MKTCNLNCIYCELGPNKAYFCERKAYLPPEEIKAELSRVLTSGEVEFDVVTFTASGEPTLHSDFGELVAFAKAITDKPVVVLTNATLVGDPQVRKELAQADILLPSLDSVVPESFRKVNRPGPGVDLNSIIEGLVALRREFSGQMWLEVLFVKGYNHGTAEIEGLKRVLARIQPDRVQLNTVARPPAEPWARPMARHDMEAIQRALGDRAEVIVNFERLVGKGRPLVGTEILDMIRRRPLSVEDLHRLLGFPPQSIQEELDKLCRAGRVKTLTFEGATYYAVSEKPTILP